VYIYQGLYHLTHFPSFSGLTLLSELASDHDPPSSTSYVAGIIGMNPPCQAPDRMIFEGSYTNNGYKTLITKFWYTALCFYHLRWQQFHQTAFFWEDFQTNIWEESKLYLMPNWVFFFLFECSCERIWTTNIFTW
jgi:hypothetical protein